MSVLIFLIPVTLCLGILGLVCFLWSLKNKQYEDLQGAASRILFDDSLKKNDRSTNLTNLSDKTN